MIGFDLAIDIALGILGLVALFGQAKLFEISGTLKEIKALLEKERHPPAATPGRPRSFSD